MNLTDDMKPRRAFLQDLLRGLAVLGLAILAIALGRKQGSGRRCPVCLRCGLCGDKQQLEQRRASAARMRVGGQRADSR